MINEDQNAQVTPPSLQSSPHTDKDFGARLRGESITGTRVLNIFLQHFRVDSLDGTAQQGEDYYPVREIITFKPNESEKKVRSDCLSLARSRSTLRGIYSEKAKEVLALIFNCYRNPLPLCADSREDNRR